MDSRTLLIRASRRLPMTRQPRLLFHQAKPIILVVVLVCAAFNLSECGPCSLNGIQSMLELEACDTDGRNVDVSVADLRMGSPLKIWLGQPSIESLCGSSNLLCFPSTLAGNYAEDDSPESVVIDASTVKSDATFTVGSSQVNNNLSWSLDYGMFMLSNRRAVSCSMNSQSGSLDDLLLKTSSTDKVFVSSCGGGLRGLESQNFDSNKNSEMIKSGYLDGSASQHIVVSPPLLDWGQNSLYVPSFACLTVANTHNDRTLFLHKPFSTNSQFYSCNFSEVLLRPGQEALFCFMFLPTWLGASSAHLILQTSSGGFLVQAKGFAVDSPYRAQLLVGPSVSSNGRWSSNLSLFNPFDETLSVEETTVWVSFSLGNGSYLTKTFCKTENSQFSDKLNAVNIKEWFDAKSDQVGMPIMLMKPLTDWDIAPGSTETIIELDLLYNSSGNAFGAFSVQLMRPSLGKAETLIVPLEADLNEGPINHLMDPVSVSLEALPSGAAEATVFALSLRNRAPYILSVVRIGLVGEGSELFQMKCLEGLILFPGSVTLVALISYTDLPAKITDPPHTVLDGNLSCRLTVLTNDSTRPEVEIPCKDVLSIWSNSDLYNKYKEQDDYHNSRVGLLRTSVDSPPLVKEATEPDEIVLRNWKSQGTASGMSVLDHHEIMYSVVQVGTHHSKGITVQNPSQHPVLVQLILNSGEIVDDCKAPYGFPEPTSGSLAVGEYALQTKYGFSIPESAVTEAYVHPHETASLGPIVFHPSKRCGWRSSALIRNNLSGVEWLSLQGSGGSFSFGLFEGSRFVKNLEFKFNLPSPVNLSPGNFYQMEETTHTCSEPLLKELCAKNMGDLPLHIRRIDVSGTECGLDGFFVHPCKDFVLNPGESIKFLISYRPDFQAVMVQRDLELVLGNGNLVIPMKANLPLHMYNLCKKSVFWMRLKKFLAVLFAAFLVLLFFLLMFPQSKSLGSQDYFLKTGKSSIAFIRHVGKTSNVHHNQKKSNKFATFSKVDGFIRSVGEKETSMLNSGNGYPGGSNGSSEQVATAQQVEPIAGCQIQTSNSLDDRRVTLHESKDVQDESKDGKLTVRIGKEKERRRRRKKKGSVAGLTGISEVSSSQSGNSTPSSPLSPVTTSTQKRLWSGFCDVDQSFDLKNQFVQMAEQQSKKSLSSERILKANILGPGVPMKSSGNCSFLTQNKPSPPKMPGKPVLLQSATFPSFGKVATPNLVSPSPLVSTSTIAPHAKAPGSKLYDKKTVVAEEKTGVERQFEYDIWGDHLFGCQLIDRSKKFYPVASNDMESHSDSFFVSGPQSLVTKSQSKAVSCSFEEG